MSRTWKDTKWYDYWLFDHLGLCRWVHAGYGRWTKRRLSKARRKAWRIRPRRALRYWESEANWKGW